MADADARVYGGRWRVVKLLGKGGQGVVYEVEDRKDVPLEDGLTIQLREALEKFDRVQNNLLSATQAAEVLKGLIRTIHVTANLPRGALKELLPLDSVNAKAASARMKSELATLRAITHPSLIAVLDEDIDRGWFVMEYFAAGPLSKTPDRYEGDALGALKALRPIVEVVALLHEAGIVHRDIKWDNVFVGANEQLVLGDCGLAIKMNDADRITDTFEKVGSTAWMPVWAYNQRLEDVAPTFDVFTLGKLLWTMIAGRPPFPIWHFDKPQYDLRKMFPDDDAMRHVHRILEMTVVDESEKCLPSARHLLHHLDEAIAALESKGQAPPSRSKPMRCRFCGVGFYEPLSGLRHDGYADPLDRRDTYRCSHCGSIAQFYFKHGEKPAAWVD